MSNATNLVATSSLTFSLLLTIVAFAAGPFLFVNLLYWLILQAINYRLEIIRKIYKNKPGP